MRNSQQPFPIEVRTGWGDYSPALRHHASQRVAARFAEFSSRIRTVIVRCSDDDPQTGARRRCDIEVMTTHAGPITASATGEDLFELIDQASKTAAGILRQRTFMHDDVPRRIA